LITALCPHESSNSNMMSPPERNSKNSPISVAKTCPARHTGQDP
jgi:hypothetical protein